MKRCCSLFLILTCAISTVFAKRKKPDYLPTEELKKVILLTDLNPSEMQELMLGQHPEVAIELRKGLSIPFKVLKDFDFFSVHLDPNLSVKIDRTCYLRFFIVRNKLRTVVSFDQKNWKQLHRLSRSSVIRDWKVSSGHMIMEENHSK